MKIKQCSCSSSYQDLTYGKNKRAMNVTMKPGTFRCTVCEKETSGVITKRGKK